MNTSNDWAGHLQRFDPCPIEHETVEEIIACEGQCAVLLRGYDYVNEYGVPVIEYEIETMYIDMLDDVYGDIQVAGYRYSTSRVLKEVDPIAYRCGLAEYIDSLVADELLVEL